MNLHEQIIIHDTLNSKLWTSDNQLLPEVRSHLIDIVNQFAISCDFPLNIVDVHLVGSQCNYTYTPYSDLDVHIVTNFELLDANPEISQLLYNALKTKFNKDYDITIKGIDVELYVEDIRSTTMSNGVYSLYQNKWIKFPEKANLANIPNIDITDKYNKCEQYIQRVLNSENSNSIQNTINDIYLIRKNALDQEGEYSEGNFLFKEIRNHGLLDALRDKYKEIRSQELTLEHLSLTEASRSDLLSKSKQSKKGFERFKKRVKSRVANNVKQYNNIDMNKLFKDNILTVDIKVKGETDDYFVKISFGGFLELLRDQIKKTGKFDLKAVTRALINGFNKDDVYIKCSCPDNAYRFAYHQTKNGTIAGDEKEIRPSDITNPNDTLGSGCKHILLVLSNNSWCLKLASTITNYVKYMEKHYERLYQTILYPAIYGKEYEEPEQLTVFDDETDLVTDTDTLDTSNEYARTKNQFKKDNTQGVRFASNEDSQLTIDDEEDSNEDNVETQD